MLIKILQYNINHQNACLKRTSQVFSGRDGTAKIKLQLLSSKMILESYPEIQTFYKEQEE